MIVSLNKPSIHFGSYTDLGHKTTQTVISPDHKQCSVDIFQLQLCFQPNGFEALTKRTYRVHLNDNSVAYFRKQASGNDLIRSVPTSELYLHDRGAYVLSHDLLGFNIIPRTDLVTLSGSGNTKIDGFGSIQEEVKGKDLRSANSKDMGLAMKNLNDLFEIYIYTVVSYDADRRKRNIILSESSTGPRLLCIDNNISGADPYKVPLVLPTIMMKHLEGQTLPTDYINRLKTFVSNREKVSEQLKPYYATSVINDMFYRAQLLIEHPTIMPLPELRFLCQPKFTKWEAERRRIAELFCLPSQGTS